MNRLVGTLFAIATLVVIAFAILNFGNYTSMRSAAEPTDAVEIECETVVEGEALVEPADSLETAVVVPPVDNPEAVE